MPSNPLPPATSLSVSDFDFALPPDLIAQHPPPSRSASRLLEVGNTALQDRQILDLPGLLQPEDVLIFNDTRVLRARLYGHKASGGQVEVLIERPLGEQEALAKLRVSKPPRPGSRLTLAQSFEVEVVARLGEFWQLRFPPEKSVLDWLECHGHLPLPPYIERAATQVDEARYQTTFARHPGSVAAPTAGLHFDSALLEAIEMAGAKIAYLTLHVGAGTFSPVRTDQIHEHVMHTERYFLPEDTVSAIQTARRRGGRVICVGTTSLRALESAARTLPLAAGSAETDIFITPGYRFALADALITNFHLPRSTLLMLVSAFAGMKRIQHAYRHAIEQRYRFFSYGDAMFLNRFDTDLDHAI
jgi:S-adenosylmethionine:tRNA ribosyltransferase-isomerase